jgi:hypothetical protein
MAGPLRLAAIMTLLCAGIVIPAPAVENPRGVPLSILAKPAPATGRDGFILRVDRASGCIWRVAVATGKRELASRPCTGAKRMFKDDSRSGGLESRATPSKPSPGVPKLNRL